MRAFWKKNKKNPVFWCGIVLFLIIVFGVPLGLNKWIINNDAFSKSSADGWASFFGSFLGGVIGGGATLIAVLATISNNREELDRQDEKERNEIIRKSAIIVYYDFKFTFGSIKDFMNDFSERARLTGPIAENEFVASYVRDFGDCMPHFNQFYFDSDWIKTVAELAACKELNIEKIYESYGNLLTIKRLIGTNSREGRLEALKVMEKIVEKDYKSQTAKYEWRTEVNELMEKLGQIGKVEEIEEIGKPAANDGESTAGDEEK